MRVCTYSRKYLRGCSHVHRAYPHKACGIRYVDALRSSHFVQETIFHSHSSYSNVSGRTRSGRAKSTSTAMRTSWRALKSSGGTPRTVVATTQQLGTTGGEPVVVAPANTQQTGSAQESVCVVCMSAARSVVLIPCGHLAVCQSCYGRLQQCPVCRSVIRGAIRSYMA